MIINTEFKGCPINSTNRLRLQDEISNAINRNPERINLLFATTGREINEAFLFYDFIQSLNFPIHIYNIGEIRSAGTVMFLAFNHRYVLPNTKFLFHAVRLKDGVIVSPEKEMQRVEFNDKMLAIFESRIKLPSTYISTMRNSLDDIWICDSIEIANYSIGAISTDKFNPPFIRIQCED